MGNPLYIIIFSKLITSKEQKFPFPMILIKTVLVIRTEILKIVYYIINTYCVVQHIMYYDYELSFTTVN